MSDYVSVTPSRPPGTLAVPRPIVELLLRGRVHLGIIGPIRPAPKEEKSG